jgi:hypothetical protein
MEGEIVYAAVGRSSSVLLLDQGGRWRLLSNGLPESRMDGAAAHPQVTGTHWLGLLPALARPDARNALVVGLGGGVALEAVPATVDAIDVIELEEEIVAANRAIADERSLDPLADPRVRLHIGDARGALRLTERCYDAIVSQPSHPWTAGSSNLYTREFFSLAGSRLCPGGVFVQWIVIRFVDAPLLRALLAALLEVFPYMSVYQPNQLALFFVVSDAPLDVAEGARAALRAAPADLARRGIHRPEDVSAGWVLDGEGAREVAGSAPPNTDDHNLLAARGSRLGKAALDPASLHRLFAPHDPFPARTEGLDRSAVIRRLLAQGFGARAEALALAADGAAREAGQGWVALARDRPRTAARHFARALELAPAHGDALAGLVASHRLALARGESVPGLSEKELDGPLAALLTGWPLESGGDWAAVSALDEELARLRPGDALFQEAARLRAAWRIAAGAPAARAEALAIADVLATRTRDPEVVLLRARAAAAAGRPATAWGALDHLADLLPTGERGRALAQRALEIADELPQDPEDRVRGRLEQRARVKASGRVDPDRTRPFGRPA